MDEKKPSEVFLALWYSRICGQVISREEFFALAETWTEIRRMEAEAIRRQNMAVIRKMEAFTPETQQALRQVIADGLGPSQSAAPTAPPQGSQESTPEGVEKVHPDRVEKVHEYTEEKDPSPAGGLVRDDSAGVVQNEPSRGPDPAKSAAAAAGMATRKKNALEKLEWLRMAQNRTMADIVDADPKLTLNVLLDFINCKPIPLPQLAAIERAIKKLEAET